jgi:hypothetical protein
MPWTAYSEIQKRVIYLTNYISYIIMQLSNWTWNTYIVLSKLMFVTWDQHEWIYIFSLHSNKFRPNHKNVEYSKWQSVLLLRLNNTGVHDLSLSLQNEDLLCILYHSESKNKRNLVYQPETTWKCDLTDHSFKILHLGLKKTQEDFNLSFTRVA